MANNLEFTLLLDFYGGLLSDKRRDMMGLYYNEDLSLSEIATHLNITRQGVRDSIKRGEDSLLQAEQAMGLVAQHQVKMEMLAEVQTALAETVQTDEHCPHCQKIRRMAQKLEDLLSTNG